MLNSKSIYLSQEEYLCRRDIQIEILTICKKRVYNPFFPEDNIFIIPSVFLPLFPHLLKWHFFVLTVIRCRKMKSKGDLLLFILPKDKITWPQLLQVRKESGDVKIIDSQM